MKECKKCGQIKEEIFFTDQNGLSENCNDCKPKTKPKVAEEIKVSNKPVNVKSTKK